MLRERRLTTLLIIVVLLNPNRIDSDRTSRGTPDSDKDGSLMAGTSKQATQQNDETKLKHDVAAAFEHAQHHHLHESQLQEKPVIHHAKEPGQENEKRDENSIEDESRFGKDGEIHVEVSDRLVRDEGAENESYSGGGSHVNVRDIHYHIHRSDPPGEKTAEERKEIDPEDEEDEFSGEVSNLEELHVHGKEVRDFHSHHPIDDEDARTEWEHFQVHLHSHEKNDDEFGYVTNEEEEADSKENDDESLSGEPDYDHAHIKTLHVHHRAKHVKHPRDSHVVGRIEQEIAGEEDEEVEDEQSGEGDLNSIYDRRNLQTIDEDNESEFHEGSLIFEDEEDVVNLSGAEGLSARDEDKIPEDNDGDPVSQAEKARKRGKEPGKKEITEDNKEEPDRQMKNTRKGKKPGNKRKIPIKNIIRKKQEKPSSGKKKGPSVNNPVPHQSQKLKIHAEIDLTHKKNHLLPKGKTSKKVLKARKNKKIRDVELETGAESELNNVGDFYIDENDEPKERMFAVEMRDVEDDKEHGQNTNPGNRKINKRAQTEEGKAEGVQEFRRGNSRHLLQIMNMSDPFNALPESSTDCIHQALAEKIADQSIVYIRTECRLCQCKMGELICDPQPEHCDQHLAKPCVLAKGELADDARHFDGCNNCVCRNGALLCTRIRCAPVNYNYTNYRTGSNNKSTPKNSLIAILDEGVARGKDWCMECDNEPVSPVCGPNWKTYRSFCHAYHCGRFNTEDVKQGKCENLHPCDGIKCAEHEICIVDRKGPCLATTTRDGDLIECAQHQCVTPKDKLNCSTAHMEKMCGEDHNIYMSKCSMFGRGVALAYYGPCKEECLKFDVKVCGVDGVTFQSTCHASLHNSHVDYPGQCDEVYPTNNYFFKNSAFVGHFNARCKTVTELLRCPGADCENHVIPEGSCCPICGTAISIRLNTAARDMISLNAKVQPPQDLNRVDAIFTDLKNLFDQFGGLGKCQLTIDLVDTHDISVVYEPITSQDEDTCKQVATKSVEFINSPAKSDLEPAKALLAVAVIKDRAEGTGLPRAESVMAKRVMKRHEHHEHEPFFNQSNRIRLHNNLLLFLVVLSLYWSTNHSQILN